MQRDDKQKYNDSVLARYMVDLAKTISGAYRQLEGGAIKGMFRSPGHSGDVEAMLKKLGALSDEETLRHYDTIQHGRQASQRGWLPARNAGVLLDAFAKAVSDYKNKFKLGTNEEFVNHINAAPGKHHYTRLLGVAVNEISKLTKQPFADYLQQGDHAIFKAGNYKELSVIAMKLSTDDLKQVHKNQYDRIPLTTELVTSQLTQSPRQEM